MKKIVVVLLLFFCLFGCTKKKTTTIETVARVTTIAEEKSNNDTLFEQKMEDIFVYFLSDSPIDVNFYVRYPNEFGLEEEVYEGISYSESNAESIEEINKIINDIKAYDDDTLIRKNRLTKEIILDFLEQTNALSNDKYIYYNSQLGSYLGYQANLPVLLSLYRFDDVEDVNDYLSYLNKTDDDFDAIIAFECKKIPLGMSLPDVVLNAVISQCESMLENSENYFLETEFEDKIANLQISDAEKTNLINLNEIAVNNFLSAYSNLKTDIMSKLLGKQSKTCAICQYGEYGKEYYELLFKQATGSDKDLKIIEQEIYDELVEQILLFGNTGLANIAADFSKGKGYKDLLDGYIANEALWNDFPRLNNTISYNLNYVDESLEDNFSPAAYLVSPYDENITEQIIINEKSIAEQDGNYIYQVMAHEGVPGHLYQNVYYKGTANFSPIRTMVECNGYTEGWATYVEEYVLKYSGEKEKTILSYQYYDNINKYFSCYLDIMINYENWGITEIGSFCRKTGFALSSNNIKEIYNQIIEIPTNFSGYYYGYYQIIQLKEKAKEICKGSYSDKAFHTFMLEFGSAPFYIIENHLSEILYYI